MLTSGEERDHERDHAATSAGRLVAAADEERRVLGEAARHRRVAEQRRDHRDPADGEADQRPERLDGVAIGAARAIGARRRLGEAERDERAQAAHDQPGERRLRARPSLQRRRQQEDAGADDAVDAETETIEQRELARRTRSRMHTTRRRSGALLRRSRLMAPRLPTWYGPLVVAVCRVCVLGALLAAGCAKPSAVVDDAGGVGGNGNDDLATSGSPPDFTVAPRCGDGVCTASSGEACDTCPADCGSCGCPMGYADCNNNMADGCETPLNTPVELRRLRPRLPAGGRHQRLRAVGQHVRLPADLRRHPRRLQPQPRRRLRGRPQRPQQLRRLRQGLLQPARHDDLHDPGQRLLLQSDLHAAAGARAAPTRAAAAPPTPAAAIRRTAAPADAAARRRARRAPRATTACARPRARRRTATAPIRRRPAPTTAARPTAPPTPARPTTAAPASP